MTQRKREQKLRLFRQGATSFASVCNESEHIYVCPLCRNAHTEDSIASGDLTLEHVPPRSMGGRGILLVCKKCNNETGFTIEAELKKREHGRSFAQAIGGGNTSGEFRVDISFPGITTNAHLNFDHARLKIVPSFKSNDSLFELLLETSENNSWSGFQINVRPPSFHRRFSDIGDLKTSYLLAFALLGYHYILGPELDVVRTQIGDPSSNLLKNFLVWLRPGQENVRQVIQVEEPFKSIAVQIDDRIVFLPPIDSSNGFYDTLRDSLDRATIVGMKGVSIPWPEQLEMRLDISNYGSIKEDLPRE